MKQVYIIAEAGVNHNGSVETAKELVSVAADSGANAVKFQTFKAETLVTKNAEKADYQKLTTGESESQFEMIKKLELDYEAHQVLIDHARSKGIDFLSTPFDLESIDMLVSLGLDRFKIPSGEITNLPYLRKIGSIGARIILSTGMATLEEVEAALGILVNSGTSKDNIIVLHANTAYPTPYEDANLNAMVTIGKVFNTAYGYSDHTPGIEVPVAAVAMGACVIEKHFTLDRAMDGPDHKASLEPNELTLMVKSIRNIEKALGDGIKKGSKSEERNRVIARKSIVASRLIKKGEKFSEKNLIVKRPGDGLSPMLFDFIIGKTAKKDFNIDDMIEI